MVVSQLSHMGLPSFQWLRDHLIMIEDYAYVGDDFHGDTDLALPQGAHWGDIGKNTF